MTKKHTQEILKNKRTGFTSFNSLLKYGIIAVQLRNL